LTTYVKGLTHTQRQGATGNKEMFTAQGSHISSTHMPSTLEPKRSVLVTSGMPDPVVKNKKNILFFNCSDSQQLH